MANLTAEEVRPEMGIPVSSGFFRTSTGRVIRRTELSNGTVIETDVFADDYIPVRSSKPNKDGDIEMQLVPPAAK